MSNYFIELSIIHLSLMAAYWLFLRKENQYGKMRAYILGTTLLSLIIPLFKLPKLFQSQKTIDIAAIVLEPIGTQDFTVISESSSGFDFNLFLWIYCLVSVLFFLKFLTTIFYLVKLEHGCKSEHFEAFRIRRVKGINGSFTFFNWIFLAEDVKKDNKEYDVILRHEKAHASLGHSYDLIFIELFKIAFWWLPSAWFIKKEIKKIHEYQADAFAVKSYSIDRYSSILISSTLKANGLSLASSFHDGLILKRLKAMKQNAKNVSPWKMGTITMLITILFVVFACSEESKAQDANTSIASEANQEVFKKVEQQPEYPGGMPALFQFVIDNVKYPEAAKKNGTEGKVMVQFVVDKYGSVTNVKAIKKIGSGCDEEAVRVVNTLADFSPGKQRGKAVAVQMVMPIMFTLTDDGSVSKKVGEVKSDVEKMGIDVKFSDGKWIGKVFDSENGKPMPGVNVIEEGTNNGTVTDFDGTFTIPLRNESNGVLLSHVGFETARLVASK